MAGLLPGEGLVLTSFASFLQGLQPAGSSSTPALAHEEGAQSCFPASL